MKHAIRWKIEGNRCKRMSFSYPGISQKWLLPNLNEMLSAGLVHAVEVVTNHVGPGARSSVKLFNFQNLRNAILKIPEQLLPLCTWREAVFFSWHPFELYFLAWSPPQIPPTNPPPPYLMLCSFIYGWLTYPSFIDIVSVQNVLGRVTTTTLWENQVDPVLQHLQSCRYHVWR